MDIKWISANSDFDKGHYDPVRENHLKSVSFLPIKAPIFLNY
jgi:hypothetical protein